MRVAAGLLVLVFWSKAAWAQTPATEAMRADMHRYFDGELAESWVWGAMGAASIGTGAGLWTSGGEVKRGAAYPMFAVGLLQLVLGVGLRLRTPGQVAELDRLLTGGPLDFAKVEQPRMKRVRAWFPAYRAVEASIFFAGVAVAGAGGVGKNDTALGVGLGMAVEALSMLLLDHFAEARAHWYGEAVDGFVVEPG